MKTRKKQKPILFLAVLLFVIAASFEYANAMSFDIGEASLDVDVQLIYGAAIRAEAPSPASLTMTTGAINADDGNRNFDKWDLTGNRISAIVDTELVYKDFALFVRAKAFYDHVYMTDSANNDTGTNNYYLAGQNGIVPEVIGVDEWPDDVKKVHGANVKLLDYFVTYNFEIGNMFGDLRVGNQAVMWGESMFISSNSIALAMCHIDAAAAYAPGSQTKEYLFPSKSVALNLILTDTITVGGYYSWKWEHTVYPEVGTFWNNLYDVVDETYSPMIAVLPGAVAIYPNGLWYVRNKDVGIDNDNQFGFKFMWRTGEWLNDSEISLYYINYHLKTASTVNIVTTNWLIPGVAPAGPVGGYFEAVYYDDLRLYGLSISSGIGDLQVSGEFTYHHGFPCELASGAIERDGIMQAQVSFIGLYPSRIPWLYDRLTLMGEVGAQWIVGFDKDELAEDKWAWGGTISISPLVSQIFRGTDMSVPISYTFRPHGTSSNATNGTFTEGAESVGVGLSFTIHTDYKLNLRYSEYFSKTDTGNVDRDNISLNFSWSF